MFETTKTLIVVYKDEMLMNQLRKLVESRDDINENQLVGTRDGSINIVAWTEKTWLQNKKKGIIKAKVLFLGDIKGWDKLTPVIDVKFEDCGVTFGWAGNQAILHTDPKAISTADAYRSFLKKLSGLPVPDMIKKPQNLIKNKFVDAETDKEDSQDENQKKTPAFVKKAQEVIESGAESVSRAGAMVAERASDLFRDKNAVRRQMLFYGVVNLYNNGLEEFMNM